MTSTNAFNVRKAVRNVLTVLHAVYVNQDIGEEPVAVCAVQIVKTIHVQKWKGTVIKVVKMVSMETRALQDARLDAKPAIAEIIVKPVS